MFVLSMMKLSRTVYFCSKKQSPPHGLKVTHKIKCADKISQHTFELKGSLRRMHKNGESGNLGEFPWEISDAPNEL